MPEPDWSLRSAQPEDHDFLFDLNETTMREHAEQICGWDHTEAFFKSRLSAF